MIVINVKLKSSTTVARALKSWRRLPGVASAVQVFPDDEDEELACHCMIEASDPDATDVADELSVDSRVEYIEFAPRRKLLRKKKNKRV